VHLEYYSTQHWGRLQWQKLEQHEMTSRDGRQQEAATSPRSRSRDCPESLASSTRRRSSDRMPKNDEHTPRRPIPEMIANYTNAHLGHSHTKYQPLRTGDHAVEHEAERSTPRALSDYSQLDSSDAVPSSREETTTSTEMEAFQ
jgi:hypothetical protein